MAIETTVPSKKLIPLAKIVAANISRPCQEDKPLVII